MSDGPGLPPARAERRPAGARRRLLLAPLYGARSAGGLLVARHFADFADLSVHPGNEAHLHRMIAATVAVYVLVAALPFVPGAEIGLGLMLMLGPKSAALVYTSTIVALMLAYLTGRVVPASACAAAFGKRLRLGVPIVDPIEGLEVHGTALAARAELLLLIRRGKAPARTALRAHILLRANEDAHDDFTATARHTSPDAVARTRRRFAEAPLWGAARAGAVRPAAPRRLAQARAQAGGGPHRSGLQRRLRGAHVLDDAAPGGQARRAAGDRRHLGRDGAPPAQKARLKPWQQQSWCTAAVGADFAWCMEEVLDLYAEPPDPARPPVGVDERPVTLRADAYPPAPCAPGQAARVDYEYVRAGTGSCWLAVAPHEGWRHVVVTAHRTNADFAHAMRWLADERHPRATVIPVVLDNLSTHSPAAFSQTLPAAEARRLTQRFEFHYTPKHARWLNVAEVEFAGLERQCLNRRLATLERVAAEVAAWEAVRNATGATVSWHFTTPAARTRLARHYPTQAA